MLLGFLALIVLGATLAVRRSAAEPPRAAAWSTRATWRAYLGGGALVVAANAPLAFIAMPFAGIPTFAPGDARSHAMIAAAIARSGLPHGWTDVYQGGFPIGPHYPSVGWALSALLIRAGASPLAAVDTVGLVAILLVPLLAFVLALRIGARLFAALFGALLLSWLSPSNAFTGGYETFYALGLLSQVVAIPIIVLLVSGVARRGPPWHATLPAAIAVACHPQIAVAAFVVMLVPVLAAWDRGALGRFVRAGAVTALVGLAIYGPGVATLKIPFGWPPMMTWQHIGFGVDHLGWWLLDGDLLDAHREPVLTALWATALLIAVLRVTSPASRAVVLASVIAMALSVSGSTLQGLGESGTFFLSFLQPLRVLCLVPIAAAAAVVVALEEAAPFARPLFDRAFARAIPHAAKPPWLVPFALGALTIALACTALPARFLAASDQREVIRVFGPGAAEGAARTPGFDPVAIDHWVRGLSQGRLWFNDDAAETGHVALSTGFELASAVPVAVTRGAGAHVGVHTAAFHSLQPARTGSARRAEALGVRHVLLFPGAIAGEGWDVEKNGGVTLAHRRGGTDIVGVGCVESVWSGSDGALRARLLAEFQNERGTDRLLDPASLIALETTSGDGDVIERRAPDSGCRASDAHVHERRREPGAYEADVETPAPVDVVFRVAAFPTWRVVVDGQPAPTKRVAPGFVTARVSPGTHHIEAVVSVLPGYFRGILWALLLAGLCSVPSLKVVRSWLARGARTRRG